MMNHLNQKYYGVLSTYKNLAKNTFFLFRKLTCFFSSIASIQKLPKLSIADPLGEIELCAGYLDPLLSLLFNDFEHNTNFRW